MTTPRKATHYGTCQACGAFQKLPAGVLALHGYEVKWEQFVGVCIGSGHQPYELSADMLPDLIASAELRAEAIRELQVRLRTPIDEPKVDWTFRRQHLGINFPEPATISGTEIAGLHGSYMQFTVTADKDGRAQLVDSYRIPHGVENAATLANYLRAQEADGLQHRIDREVRYANWQNGRLADWKIRPLREVIEIDAEEAAAKRSILGAKKAERDEKKRAKILRDGQRAERLIAKFEKLVPTDVRQNLASFTHQTLHDELRKRNIYLPSTVNFLLSDMLSEARGEKHYRYVPDPWKQVEAVRAIEVTK
jgi:hypothetical protein